MTTDALAFFHALYRNTDGWVTVSGLNGDAQWHDSIKSARTGGDLTRVLCDGEPERWFRVQPQTTEKGRKETNTAGVVALFADFDFAGSSDTKKLAPFNDLDDVARFCGVNVPLPVSAVVLSGHGAHVYWFLSEPLPPAEGKALLVRLDLHLRARAKTEGKQLDPMQDTARVLRVPGSINAKHPDTPVDVTVEHLFPERRYSGDDFDWLPETPQEPLRATRPAGPPVEVPPDLRRKIENEDGNGDKSMAQVYLVHACLTAGLTVEQTWEAVQANPATVEKWGHRSDWRRNFDKIVHDHDFDSPVYHVTTGEKVPVDELIAGIEPLDLSQLDAAIPDEDFLVEPIIATGRRTKIHAAAGDGKSLLALYLAACLATGRPCLRRPAGDPLTVVYLDREMIQADLQERLADMGFDYTNDVLLQTNLRYYLHQDIDPLNTKRGADQVLALVARDQARFVVVDTITSQTEGNENDAEPYRQMATFLTSKLVMLNVASLTLDHLGKDKSKGGRGSSAKRDAFDVIWSLSSTTEAYTLTLDKGRMRTVPEMVRLTKETDPVLRFTMPMLQISNKAAELVLTLERLNIPHNVGRPTVTAALKDADISYHTPALTEAIRWRKHHPKTDPNTVGSAVGSAENEDSTQPVGSVWVSSDGIARNVDAARVPSWVSPLGQRGSATGEAAGSVPHPNGVDAEPDRLTSQKANQCPSCEVEYTDHPVCINRTCHYFHWFHNDITAALQAKDTA